MRLNRLLPPLVLVAVLGAVAWSAAQRPRKDRERRDIEIHWEDSTTSARERLIEQLRRYADQYTSPEDRAFVAHAFLRARDPGSAFQARWPDLERPLPVDELRAFAEEALFALGWEDEALARPSPTNIQCLLALVEGGNAKATAILEHRLATEPIDELYVSIRRSLGMPSARVRAVVSRACRARGAAEEAQGRPAIDWTVAAALLAARPEPYPERDADLAVLRTVVGGTWRVQYAPRWAMACRSLGESGDPGAIAHLRAVLANLEGGGSEQDARDAGVVRAALLASGDWEQEPVLRELATRSDKAFATARVFYQDALLARWRAGDTRAQEGLGWFWARVSESPDDSERNLALRERLGRLMLLLGPMPGEDVPVERMLADLEAPGQPAACAVIAKGFRVRRGTPGAREALVAWLAGSKAGSLVLSQGMDPERTLAPPIAGLRALYLAP